ncbi:methyltransferase, TIGR04325 family [Leptospira sp. GIMC2001]|uniref:methyltransferase, TIGR04325 family n=1 Tax=Leptospira sp. GIMC2001 TaxID=1513297 RepID=UPI00234B95C3|nr:methyltransferase, TIGR04325 family [Leptospira sp. GIMC2001]WCL50626.1 methyltransferase, TIGR04325 family [Leptospira sp. GIMC2001]
MRLKDFVPPIVIKVINKEKVKDKETEKEYQSYHDALNDYKTDGYENIELCNMIAEKTKNYSVKLNGKPYILNPTNVALLSAINQFVSVHPSNKLSIIDFGGACGAHYFEMRRFLPDKIRLNWLVVETSQMVQSAKNMKLDNEELKFYDSLESITLPIDIIHSSGALQYVPEPYEYLSKLLNFKARWIFFNRMMFNEANRDIITVQKSKLSANGPGPMPDNYEDKILTYPHTTMSFEKFNDNLTDTYHAEWIFEENSGSYKINNEKIVGKGLLYTEVKGDRV